MYVKSSSQGERPIKAQKIREDKEKALVEEIQIIETFN